MDNPKLPHLRVPPEEPEEFTTVEREMAKMFGHIHPHYDETDTYGNKPLQPVKKDDKPDNETS